MPEFDTSFNEAFSRRASHLDEKYKEINTYEGPYIYSFMLRQDKIWSLYIFSSWHPFFIFF